MDDSAPVCMYVVNGIRNRQIYPYFSQLCFERLYGAGWAVMHTPAIPSVIAGTPAVSIAVATAIYLFERAGRGNAGMSAVGDRGQNARDRDWKMLREKQS